jgi:Protein of unknown function (DUF2961)
MRRPFAALLVTATALFVTLGAWVPTARAVTASKGPIGWDVYRHLDQLPYLTTGVRARQFSSFDRAQANNDHGHVLTTASDGAVIAEHQGPGEVDAIWDTLNGGDVTNVGNIKVILDGITIFDAPLQSVVNGGLGAPFVYPLVGNADQSSGGDYIAVPMPFRSSMRITTSTNDSNNYYHVTYRTFSDANGVSTFDPADKATDVLTMLQASGTRDPKPAVSGAATRFGTYALAPGQTATIGQASGSGELTALRLRVPQAVHPVTTPLTDDGRAFGSGGYSQFTASLDPSNTAVRLTRRLDPSIGNQVANVLVDGVQVAQWTAMAAVTSGPWADQTVSLPASSTAGKSTITIRNAFVSSNLDFNEFTYFVDQQVGGVWSRADTIDVGPDHTAVEAAHGYQIASQTWQGVRTFQYPLPGSVTDDGRAFGSGGSSQFTLTLDPANNGVRLLRRLDTGVGNQKANVSVDGVQVAQWAPLPAAGTGQFADEAVELPASATAGKSTITLTNTFVSSDLDFNEFTYWADDHLPAGLGRTDTVDVGNAASESSHGYRIVGQTWSGSRTFGYRLDDTVLGGTRVRVIADGTQTVDAPLTEFFGTARGIVDVRSLFSGVDPRPGGWFSSWWPMPYRSSLSVQLYNGSNVYLTAGESAVTTAAAANWDGDLASGAAGYFRTYQHAGPTTNGQDWPFIQAAGHGKFVGVVQGVQGQASAGESFLEGNERVYSDGSRSPEINGTGTEDFYHGGWYFNRGAVTNPTTGQTFHEYNTGDCPSLTDCVGVYRLFPAGVSFNSSLTFGIEHGPHDDVAATYWSTAFYYGQGTAVSSQTDSLIVGDTNSEAAHGYSSANPGAITSLTSDYEGNDGAAVNMTQNLRATTAAVTFALAVDPANQGVIVQRTSDQNSGYQRAEVVVDGTDLGQWLEPLGNPNHRWLDDDYLLPPALTAGKSRITVTITPIAGWPAWTAASYRAMSVK